VSLNEGIDTTTAQGRLTFHIFGALAEFERELAHERTMAGLRAARERGRVGGRPRALNEEDVPELQALMKDPDVSTTGICERFDVSKATLYRYVGSNGERRRWRAARRTRMSHTRRCRTHANASAPALSSLRLPP